MNSVVLRIGGMAVTGSIGLAGLLVCQRHWSGALKAPLNSGLLFAVAIAAGSLAATARTAWLQGAAPARGLGRRWLPLVVPSVALLILAVGLTSTGAGTSGAIGFGALLVAEEACSWWWHLRAANVGTKPLSALRRFVTPRRVTKTFARRRVGRGQTPRRVFDVPLAAGEQIVERMVRSGTADGAETLRGLLRARFVRGRRRVNLHVAFCPPFAQVPRLEFRQFAGRPAEVRLGQLLPQGARFEVKLESAASRPSNVWLEFAATAATDRALYEG